MGRPERLGRRQEDRHVLQIDIESGAVLDSIASPGYFPSGLAWDGKLLWSTDPADAKIYATDVSSGKTVIAIDAPAAGPMGIAWERKIPLGLR